MSHVPLQTLFHTIFLFERDREESKQKADKILNVKNEKKKKKNEN